MGRGSFYEFRKPAIVEAIRRLSNDDHTPSVREIAEVTDIPVSSLHGYLDRLREEGVVTWRKRKHRSLQLKDRPR